jgi:hypothetical protein
VSPAEAARGLTVAEWCAVVGTAALVACHVWFTRRLLAGADRDSAMLRATMSDLREHAASGD